MICKKLDTCSVEISAFAYMKACQGDYKFAYCPRHQTRDKRAPIEWEEFYRLSTPKAKMEVKE